MPETPLNESIKDIKEYQDKLKKAAEESQDVKDGKCTLEDELKEPAYVLYNQIAESSIKILEIPAVVNIFAKLSKTLGEDMSKSIVELFALTMTQSAHQAVLFYDDLLKAELTKQFDNIGEHVNKSQAELEGIKEAINVHRKKIGEIENRIKIDTFIKDNDISPTKGE